MLDAVQQGPPKKPKGTAKTTGINVAYMGNSAALNNASTSSDLAVYGIFPTYNRRPSAIACGICPVGRPNEVREGRGEGDAGPGLLVLLSPFIRQLGELKARPFVRTFWNGELGAVNASVRLLSFCSVVILVYAHCSSGLISSAISRVLY